MSPKVKSEAITDEQDSAVTARISSVSMSTTNSSEGSRKSTTGKNGNGLTKQESVDEIDEDEVENEQDQDNDIENDTENVAAPGPGSEANINEDSDSKSGKKKQKPLEKPKAFTIKYKRPRGSRACTVCRSRKVRCDAEIHIPCTNCITFGCDCVLPEVKKRGNSSQDSKPKRRQTVSISSKDKITVNDEHDHSSASDINNGSNSQPSASLEKPSDTSSSATSGASSNEPILNISSVSIPPSLTSTYKTRPSIHKRELVSSNNRAALTFLGSSSVGVVVQRVGENHVQLTSDIYDFTDNSMDAVELEILKLRGAFLLPSFELQLDLINSYFEHVHPLMPVLNRTQFMYKFNDPNDNPSLMLLQAVLLCGCRVSRNPLLFDSKGSSDLAALTFFRRAKSLYEANYESDPVSVVQTLILIGSYWEGPEDVTKNSFYWTRVAVGLAQGFGFQRDVNNSKNLTTSEKKIWRRIWWCLFEKDRNVAIAFGRPSVIDLNDCDVPMLTLDDFNEDDPELEIKSPYPVNETEALYFIHLVKLAEITGIIIRHQYSVKSEQLKRKNKFSIIQHCDMLMGIWFTNLPPQLVFSLTDQSTQNFYSCLLNAQYYNRLYLIHRSNLIRMAKSSSTDPNNYKYPSWGISFQSARMISIISKILLDGDQIKYCPVMYVYIAFSALVMLIYHVDSSNSVIASTASDSLFVSRAVLRELAGYWPVAGVLMKFFDKYANDKIKRAKVIENGTRIAEFQELHANQNDQKNGKGYFEHVSNNNAAIKKEGPYLTGNSPSGVSATSGVSPGGEIYNDYQKAQYVGQQNDSRVSHAQPVPQKNPNIDELVQQYKQKDTSAQKLQKDKTVDTSPASSTQSFPNISLVTEKLPANHNFFENFEPTQLFPDIRYSYPPTRVHSPSAEASAEPIGSNVYASSGGIDVRHRPTNDGSDVVDEAYPSTTPGASSYTNFIDSSFINMNLQSGIENSSLTDDIASLFNLKY
ncbi:hypothetical protein G9P44_003510 [Scheffersomyces stipitis]|nr:hypothetical protein G9P44_003510 [Scheffersomyces stipitis]